MNTLLLNMGISFFVGMILSAALHIFFSKKTDLNEIFLSSISAIIISAVISIAAVSLIFWDNEDFVADITLQKYLIPLCGSLIILFASYTLNLSAVIITSAAISALSVYYTDIAFNFSDSFPHWINILLTIITMWIFSCGFYCVSGLTPFPQSQGLIIAIGMIALTLLQTAPTIIGISSSALAGVLIVAYTRGKYQPISPASAPALGYLLAWLGLISYPEYLLPCFITFSMYYIMECLIAVARKIISFKYTETPYNTTLYKLFEETNSSQLVSRCIWSTGLLLIIFGLFQINGPNPFSLPMFTVIICALQQYRAINWNHPDLSFKEANKEVVTSIKKSFNEILNIFNKHNHEDKK